MSPTPNALSEETLLAELGWVHRLAHSLVRDPSAADDIAQDAYLVALERPPREARGGASLRAWLSRVTHRLARGHARGEDRRKRREARALRHERDDTDLVEAVALRRDVVAAVLALDEPSRSTLLRFHFEERSAQEIAEISGVSEAAVRQRLVRARAALRDRLAQTFGGGERGWVRALLPLLREPEDGKRGRAVPIALWFAGTAAAFLLGLLVVQRSSYGTDPADPAATEEEPVRYAYEPNRLPLVPDPRAARERHSLATWLLEPGPPSSGPSRGSGRIMAASVFGRSGLSSAWGDEDLAADLDLGLHDFQPLDAAPVELAERVSQHSGHPAALVAKASLFSATCQHPTLEKAVACRVVRMPLDPKNQEARLVLAVYEGRVLTLGAWGRPEFDEDPDLRWAMYLQQLTRCQEAGPVRDLSVPGFDDVSELLEEIGERDDEDGLIAQVILAQRITMASNAMAGAARRALEARSLYPSPEWFPPVARRFRALSKASEGLAIVIGEEQAAIHSRYALSAADAFEAYSEALETTDDEAIERARIARRDTCGRCHNAASIDGPTFFDAFDPFVEGLDLPRGSVHLEFDIAPALGDGGEWSGRLAAAFRAALVLANELP